jgi:hypothetical protein
MSISFRTRIGFAAYDALKAIAGTKSLHNMGQAVQV